LITGVPVSRPNTVLTTSIRGYSQALVPVRLLLDHAAENGLLAFRPFNVKNLEQVQSIMEAAYETGQAPYPAGSAGPSVRGENFFAT